MTRASDRKAARREARARRAELRLFAAAWRYTAAFDLRTRAPVLASPGAAERAEVPSVVELLAELEAAVFHFAEVVPPRRSRRHRRRRRRSGRRAAIDELWQRYLAPGAWPCYMRSLSAAWAGESEMIELTARTVPDAMIRALLEAGQREGRADLCAACTTALRYPTTIRTLADAARRFIARAWCADELNRRARLAMADTAVSSERR